MASARGATDPPLGGAAGTDHLLRDTLRAMAEIPGVSLHDALAAVLEPLGPWPPGVAPLRGSPEASGVVLWKDERVETGVWECTPGAYPSRRDGQCEVMHVIAGDGTVTSEDGTVHALRPGAVVFLPDGWRGIFEIRATVRKTYVSVSTR